MLLSYSSKCAKVGAQAPSRNTSFHFRSSLVFSSTGHAAQPGQPDHPSQQAQPGSPDQPGGSKQAAFEQSLANKIRLAVGNSLTQTVSYSALILLRVSELIVNSDREGGGRGGCCDVHNWLKQAVAQILRFGWLCSFFWLGLVLVGFW